MEANYIAEICHEANRCLQRKTGEVVNFPWENTSQELRDSAIDGVLNVINNNATPEQSHENWCSFKTNTGWIYGEIKDFAKKTHPCLVPYNELPIEQKLKDTLFHGIVNSLKDA